jgi:hypothetical protein
MLAALGATVMLAGMYVFVALRMPASLVCAMLAVGLLLVAGQFVHVGRGEASSKGDASGR